MRNTQDTKFPANSVFFSLIPLYHSRRNKINFLNYAKQQKKRMIETSLRKQTAVPCWGRFARRYESAIQRRKFYTDNVNQCLHSKSGSHRVPNANLFNFTFLLVDFGKVLCSSVNELQQNSNASSRVSVGLTDRRKTAKHLVDSCKN